MEAKVNLMESGAGSSSLKTLSTIYDNNCEMARTLDSEILDAQKSLSTVQASILIMEKQEKKLERRRVNGIGNVEDLTQLENIRITLNDKRLIR